MIDFEHLETYRENNRLEAKTAMGGFPESLWETYSAFANTMGGLILLGVVENPDKSFYTVDLPDPDALIAELFRGLADGYASVNLLSAGDAFVQTVGCHRIVVIRVPRADRLSRPVYIERNPSLAYKRNGEGDCKATPEEYAAMVRDSRRESQDMTVLTGFSCSDFARESVQSFRGRVEALRPGSVKGLSEEEFLTRIGALATDGQTLRPTAAGLLMFGKAKAIRRAFPRYRLRYTEGRRTVVSSDEPHFGNLCDFFFRVLAHLRSAFPDEGDSSVFAGLREALTNCLTNADYLTGGTVRIRLTREAIAFENPGTLRVAPEDYFVGSLSDPRNSLLHHLFHLADAGRLGAGVPLLYRIWRENGLKEPILAERTGPDRVVLTLPLTADVHGKAGEPPYESEALIIDYLTSHPRAAAGELADYLRIPLSRLNLLLDDLDARGLLVAETGPVEILYRLRS